MVYRSKAYLSVIHLAGAEQSLQRVITWNDESSKVREELASDVEEDEEEVDADEPEEGIDLGHGSLLLEVVQGWVFGQLQQYAGSVFLFMLLASPAAAIELNKTAGA